jgi:16S rRNA (cytidine1402-2'-O)-methyltransferase
MEKGVLYLIPTPIGNLGDMTFRAVQTLKTVDVIAAEDTRTSKVLLNHYGIHGKLVSYHKFNERKQSGKLVELLMEGQSVAVITDAGTPGISDPASILVRAALDSGISITCLPGATALIPALAASGLDTSAFTFTGFLPAKPKERKALLTFLATLPHTVAIYESSHHIKQTLSEIAGFFKDRGFALAREISKLHETFYRGSFSDLSFLDNLETRGEFVIVLEGSKLTEMTEAELLSLVQNEMKAGQPIKELCEEVSRATGVSRNRIYRIALSLKTKS